MRILDFAPLSKEEKIAIIQKNQELLIKFQPNSDYIIRENTKYKSSLHKFYSDIINKYKGKVFVHDDFLLLFSIVQIPDDYEGQYKRNIEDEFVEDGNCLYIDYIGGKIDANKLKGNSQLKSIAAAFMQNKKIKFTASIKYEKISIVPIEKHQSFLDFVMG